MRADVVGLNAAQAKVFCIRLWFELTIVGRGIWSDETIGSAEQLNALKWLNEIQHRVWSAYSSAASDALDVLLDQVASHSRQAPALQAHMRVALERALLVARDA